MLPICFENLTRKEQYLVYFNWQKGLDDNDCVPCFGYDDDDDDDDDQCSEDVVPYWDKIV